MPIRENAVRANFAQGGKHPRVWEVETRETRDTCEHAPWARNLERSIRTSSVETKRNTAGSELCRRSMSSPRWKTPACAGH